MANVLLSARDIKIRFGGVVAADGIDLDVLEGENLAIIGPNGAGKTTFLNISTGYLRPQAGTVTFWPRHHRASAAHDHQARHCARVPDSATVPRPDRDREHADRGRFAAGTAVGLSCLSACRKCGNGAVARSGRRQILRRAKARELPEGQRKLVDIALALALKPKLLLMDEPTSGVVLKKESSKAFYLQGAAAEAKQVNLRSIGVIVVTAYEFVRI